MVTGWFAEFGELTGSLGSRSVTYAAGADRFAGATYDPASHYRGARVFGFFAEQGLSAAVLRRISLRQNRLLADCFDALDLPDEVVTRDRATPHAEFGGFLALRCADAPTLRQQLARRGVHTDSRGSYLRLGPAPYLTDTQLRDAVAALGEAVLVFPGPAA